MLVVSHCFRQVCGLRIVRGSGNELERRPRNVLRLSALLQRTNQVGRGSLNRLGTRLRGDSILGRGSAHTIMLASSTRREPAEKRATSASWFVL